MEYCKYSTSSKTIFSLPLKIFIPQINIYNHLADMSVSRLCKGVSEYRTSLSFVICLLNGDKGST